jgi:hypothetical protein
LILGSKTKSLNSTHLSTDCNSKQQQQQQQQLQLPSHLPRKPATSTSELNSRKPSSVLLQRAVILESLRLIHKIRSTFIHRRCQRYEPFQEQGSLGAVREQAAQQGGSIQGNERSLCHCNSPRQQSRGQTTYSWQDRSVSIVIYSSECICVALRIGSVLIGLDRLTPSLSLTIPVPLYYYNMTCSVKNSLSPKWTTCFDLDYELGSLQRINIGVYDEIRKSQSNKPMGSALFEVGEVLGTRGNTKAKKLRKGGTLFCRITPVPVSAAGILRLTLGASGLKNVAGAFGKSDPFYEVSANVSAAGGLTWQPVFRSEHVQNNLSPVWKQAVLDMSRLCDGDMDKAIQITIWDWHKSGRHENMGLCETSVAALMAAVGVDGGSFANALMVRKKGKDTGKLLVRSAQIENGGAHQQVTPMAPPSSAPAVANVAPSLAATATAMSALGISKQSAPYIPAAASNANAYASLPPPMAPPAPRPSFVDYLTGGCEIEMRIAIDFTGSNGDPRKPGTLHYIHPDGQLNDYEKALTAVGSIIARYDSDQSFPVWGFGAKYGGVIQHCFQIGNSPSLEGIAKVLEAYRATFLTGLTMSGPTVFAEVINIAAAQCRSKQEQAARVGQQAYTILLILTDGAVSNVEETTQAIHAAGDAPMSIVIVGIGDADFSSMHFLDNFQDNSGSGRDICQFVEFSKHKHDKRSLTRETLDEIPEQLVDYFFSKGIKPLPPISGSQISLVGSEADEEDVDLNLEGFEGEGEISLANYNGAVYDDSKYDTMSTYAPSAPSAPYQASASTSAYVPQAQHQNHAAPQAYGQQMHGSNSQPPPAPYGAAPPGRYVAPPAGPYGASQYPPRHSNGPVATGVAVPDSVFHVQVPPGVSPGSQLQVQNPVTHQHMVVTIPPGIQPGGTFAVRY